MKNIILLIVLPFILGCTATAQTTPSNQPKTNRVETFSQLDSTEPAERPTGYKLYPNPMKDFILLVCLLSVRKNVMLEMNHLMMH